MCNCFSCDKAIDDIDAADPCLCDACMKDINEAPQPNWDAIEEGREDVFELSHEEFKKVSDLLDLDLDADDDDVKLFDDDLLCAEEQFNADDSDIYFEEFDAAWGEYENYLDAQEARDENRGIYAHDMQYE